MAKRSRIKSRKIKSKDEAIDELVQALARPLFVYRMSYSTALHTSHHDGITERILKGANTKLTNSRAEIDAIVSAYVKGESLSEWLGE